MTPNDVLKRLFGEARGKPSSSTSIEAAGSRMGSRLPEFTADPQARRRKDAAASTIRTAKRWRNIAVCVTACAFGIAFVLLALDLRPQGDRVHEAVVRKLLRDQLGKLNADQSQHAAPPPAAGGGPAGGDGGAGAWLKSRGDGELDDADEEAPTHDASDDSVDRARVTMDEALQLDEGGGSPCEHAFPQAYIVDGECRDCPTATHNYRGFGNFLAASCTPCGLAGQAPCEAPDASPCSSTLARAYIVNGLCAECAAAYAFEPGGDVRTATCKASFKCGAPRQRACSGPGLQPCDASIPNAHIVKGRCYHCKTSLMHNYNPGSGPLSATCTPCGSIGTPFCTSPESPTCQPGIKRPYILNGRCAQCPLNAVYSEGTGTLNATCQYTAYQGSAAQPSTQQAAAPESDADSEPEPDSDSGSEQGADEADVDDEASETPGDGVAAEESLEQTAPTPDKSSDGVTVAETDEGATDDAVDGVAADDDPCGGRFEFPYMVDGACVECLATNNNYDPASGASSASCVPCGRVGEPPCDTPGVPPCSGTLFRPYVVDGKCRDCAAGIGEYDARDGPLTASCARTCGQLRLPACQLKDAQVPPCDEDISQPYVLDGKCMSCATDTHHYEAGSDAATAVCVPKLESQQGPASEATPASEPRDPSQPGPAPAPEPARPAADGGKAEPREADASGESDDADAWRKVNDDSFGDVDPASATEQGDTVDDTADDDPCAGLFEHPYMVHGACLDCLVTDHNYEQGEGSASARCRPCGRLGEEPCRMPGARPCSSAILQPYVVDGKCIDCPVGIAHYAALDGPLSATCKRNCGQPGMPACGATSVAGLSSARS